MPKIYFPSKKKGKIPKEIQASEEKVTSEKEVKKRGILKTFLYFMLWGFVGFLIFAIGVMAYFTKDLPSPEGLSGRHVNESTKILDRKGETVLYEIHGEENRTAIPFDKMPKCIKDATLSAEDSEFYNHHGLDFKAILRAAISDIIGGSKAQGASTITQQLVKNSVLDRSKTFKRKIKEAILSLELEQKFSKDEILEMYLNQIPYGSNAYGVQSAAQTFFGKDAENLSLSECATLAAIPKAPTYYSPYGNNTEELKGRSDWVLSRMAELGYITEQEAEIAKQDNAVKRVVPFFKEIKAAHFVMFVKDWLLDKYGEEAVQSGGFKVYTTLDFEKQQWAEEAVRAGAERNEKNYNSKNAALVSINPKNGEILAMVGSRDYFDKENDGNVNVATRLRQPGSSFKPFVYAMAFAKGYSPDTILFDVKTNFKVGDKDYIPQNFNGNFNGPVSMREALASSLNIPAVKALYLVGVDNAVDFAKSMGISTLTDTKNYGLALVLGGGAVTLLQETSAYGVFANDGIRHEPQVVLKIEDSSGKVIYEKPESKGRRVIPEEVARSINSVLSDNGARAKVFGSHSPLYIDGFNVAAKTGTTQEFKDGWTVGYTPQVVTGVWTGNNDNSSTRAGEGLYVAAPIWNEYMSKFLPTVLREKFIEPTNAKKPDKMMLNGKSGEEIEVRIDKKTGLLAEDDCPDKYTKKKKFLNAHSILYYVDRDDPLGPIPKKPQEDPMFKYWEEGVQKWGQKDDKNDKKDKKDDYSGSTPPTEKACSRSGD